MWTHVKTEEISIGGKTETKHTYRQDSTIVSFYADRTREFGWVICAKAADERKAKKLVTAYVKYCMKQPGGGFSHIPETL